MDVLEQLGDIFRDEIALKVFMVAATICSLACIYRLIIGIYFSFFFITSLSLTYMLFVIKRTTISKHLQEFIQTVFKLNGSNETKERSSDDEEHSKIILAKGLDSRIEQFFNKLLNQFISSWFSKVSNDDAFVHDLKFELANAFKKIANRYRNVNYPVIITTKLLPIVYSHFSQLEHSIKTNQSDERMIKSFLDNQISIHPATTSRKAELQYLRSLSENLIPCLFSTTNFKCRAAYNIVRELFTNWIFLPITDIISEPEIINSLVILATNPNTTKIKELIDQSQVELLANFCYQHNEANLSESDQRLDGKFFKDQEKLYNFMQYLKSKNCEDVEILKFVLDVEHLNSELDKSSVICDPVKLTHLQTLSEKLLLQYRNNLFKKIIKCNGSTKPTDLIQSYNDARKHLEYKWKYDFYKSADYYKYIYGDRDNFIVIRQEKEGAAYLLEGGGLSNQKLSAKIKSAMSMKIAVDGIEECDIQVWDAMDATNNSPIHYYNSMAVKLRKEKGQDLDSFMYSFYHSIEQEADVGEDIIDTQSKLEKQHARIKLGNIELYKNLLNIQGQSPLHQLTATTFVMTPTQCLMYFLTKVIKFHEIFLRIIAGIFKYLPDSDKLVCSSIRKIAEKLINQAILAHLINELEEKLFHSKPQPRPTQEELDMRKKLALERLEKIWKGLSTNLLFLQNPILNKHLVYSLLDVIIMEGFNELNPNLMPK